MVAAVAGDLDHRVAAEGLESRFAGTLGGATPDRRPPDDKVEPLRVTRRATEQAHVVLGIRSVDRFDDRRYALAILNHVLGGGLSSRLFQEIRERRGLAYSVWSDRVAYHDAGTVSVGMGTAPEHVPEVLDIVAAELEMLGAEGITERELAIAKGNLRAETLLACEDSGAQDEPDRSQPAAPRGDPDRRPGPGPGGGGDPRGDPRRRRGAGGRTADPLGGRAVRRVRLRPRSTLRLG